ncbi:hypothetical protein B0H14DRAFT_2887305, partial [Mycena olivaceomarginata]
MLSALWTIFSLGAGALARRTTPARQRLFVHADSQETIFCRERYVCFQEIWCPLTWKDSGWDMGTSSSFAFHKEPAPMHIRLEHV